MPATEGDGHKHKKNALSDGQGRLAWILLAPTLLVILVVAGIPVAMSIRESFYQTNSGVDPTTGLIAAGDKFVGLQNFTSSRAKIRWWARTALWIASGMPSSTPHSSLSSA